MRYDTLRSVHCLLQVLRAQHLPALKARLFLPHVHTEELIYAGVRRRSGEVGSTLNVSGYQSHMYV